MIAEIIKKIIDPKIIEKIVGIVKAIASKVSEMDKKLDALDITQRDILDELKRMKGQI